MKKFYAAFLFVFVTVTSLSAQSYCIPSGYCDEGDVIDNFSTTGGTTNINNLGTGCSPGPDAYFDYSATQILTTIPGATINLTIQCGPMWEEGFTIWIDYNDNGSFYDAGEQVWTSGVSSFAPFNGSFTIPLSASGNLTMRVGCEWLGCPLDPCVGASYGETEDYAVILCTVPASPVVTTPVNSCVGSTATLNATGSSGVLTWYNVAVGGTAQGTGTTFTTPVFVTAGPDTFWVAAENGGCNSPRVPIIVNVAAGVNVNLGADTTICGSSFGLDAGYPGSSYLWSSGQGTQTINVTTSGSYSVQLVTAAGCQGTDNIVVTLVPPPNYSLGSDTSTCGGSVVLDAGSGFTSYTWSDGATTQNTTVSTNDTLGVTVVDVNGCILTDTIIVILSPAPSVNIGPDITQCGGSVLLDAGNPGALFFWSNSTSSQTTTVSSTGTYFVNVLTQAGCSDADTVNITINNQPVVNLGPDTSICLSNVILDAGNPGSTYLWSNSQTSQTVTVGSGTFNVLVTDPSGCSDRDTISITTNVPPTVTASQDTAICPGGTATLTASGAMSYLWSNNAVGSPTTVTPTTNTAYYVTGTDPNGCQASDIVVVTLLSSANALFTSNVVGATASFTNQSTGAFSYNWNFGDATPANSTASPSHIYTANGTYTVTLTVTGPCGVDTYTMTVTITEVGVGENEIENTLSIFPNPNNGQFTVSFTMEEATDVTLELTDVAGRVISSTKHDNALSVTQTIDGTELADGVYFMRIITADVAVTKKVVVQK